MFYYVEVLRAQRALRIIGIVLGLALLGGLIFRLSFINHASPQAYITDIENSPTAHVTETKLPDGSTRKIVDDPQKHRHAVITQQGRAFKMDLTEPADAAKSHEHDSVSMGSLNVNEDTHSSMSHVTVNYSGTPDISIAALFVGSTLLGLLAATILAGPLSKENDGHLELAWTKPVSREAYAGAAFAIDVVTIVLSQLACIMVALICILMWTVPTIRLGNGGFTLIALTLLVPIAWYACLTAFSASLKRGPGMVIGCGWFAALIIPSVMAATTGATVPLVQGIHAVFQALAYLDPLMYFPNVSHGHFRGEFVDTIGGALLGTAILSVVYIAVAVLQWRRVEA